MMLVVVPTENSGDTMLVVVPTLVPTSISE